MESPEFWLNEHYKGVFISLFAKRKKERERKNERERGRERCEKRNESKPDGSQ